MSKFANNKELDKVDLGDGDWCKIPRTISYADLESIDTSDDAKKTGMSMMVSLVREWNLKEDGKIVEITIENLKRLDLGTYRVITEAIQEKMGIKKKD